MDPKEITDFNKVKMKFDYQLTRSIALMHYNGTGEVLKAVNELILQGKTTEQILDVLEMYKKI